MTERLMLHRCEICGNIVQVMHPGEGILYCCGQPMTQLQPHLKEEEKGEKHVPVFLSDNVIQVGSEMHPMIEDHYIEFIQSFSDDKRARLRHTMSAKWERGRNQERESPDLRR